MVIGLLLIFGLGWLMLIFAQFIHGKWGFVGSFVALGTITAIGVFIDWLDQSKQ